MKLNGLFIFLSFFLCFFLSLSTPAASSDLPHGQHTNVIIDAGFDGNSTTLRHSPGSRKSPEYLQLFVKETSWYNDIVLFFLPEEFKSKLSHTAATWLRNYVAGCLVYFVTGGIWSFYIYTLRGNHFFKPEAIPSREAIVKQIIVSMKSMPLYVTLPTVSEYFVEQGFTKCYSSLSEQGLAAYAIQFVIYMCFVEFWIYWMHRWLHEIKPLYKWFHAAHHIYNKQNTLSPFASLAFHPIDGILQACPHVFALFLIPTHFTTHLGMLFLEGLWTTNIHDNIDENMFPIMGAAYHTIHHTTYKHNYGHYTVVMDYLFGTLREPERSAAVAAKKGD